MGRKSKYERAGAKLADEIESGLEMCSRLGQEIEAARLANPMDAFPIAAAKSYLQMLQNTVKTKMAYDAANKAFADSLTAVQEQKIVIDWIVNDMTPDTRKRFMAKLSAALAGEELTDD